MIVGLTGGIGSGKSTVAKLFKELGCLILNADEISKGSLKVISVNHKQDLLDTLGVDEQEIYSEGELDNTKLATLIFPNPIRRKLLEVLLYPRIKSYVDLYKKECGNSIIIYESALLIESGRFNDMDYVVVVIAQENIRINRLVKFRFMSEEMARQRISVQMPQEEKVKLADYIIDNSNDFIDNNGIIIGLRDQVSKIFEDLRRKNGSL